MPVNCQATYLVCEVYSHPNRMSPTSNSLLNFTANICHFLLLVLFAAALRVFSLFLYGYVVIDTHLVILDSVICNMR